MMSKERLEEIKAQYHLLTRNGYDLGAWDEPFSWLIERVQELEEIKNDAIEQIDVTQERNKRLENRVQDLESENRALKAVAKSNKFIGEQYLEQNKRYRDFFQRILELQLYINYTEEELWKEVLKISEEALEGEE